VAPGAIVPLYGAFLIVTCWPLWLNVPLNTWLIVWPDGRVPPTVQLFRVLEPVLVITMLP
jgi:hypothetical protein